LISEAATLSASEEAAIKQAKSASDAAKRLIDAQDQVSIGFTKCSYIRQSLSFFGRRLIIPVSNGQAVSPRVHANPCQQLIEIGLSGVVFTSEQ